MAFTPDLKILEKYASVLVNFALNGGEGIKKGEVVLLEVPECAKPILIPLQRAVLKAGGHYVTNYLPDETARHFYELAEEHHLDFFPAKLLKGRVDEIDHSIWIVADANKKELEGISPEKIMRRNNAFKQYKDWRNEKENAGKFSWTLGIYGTEAMAREAGASIEEYWEQIINACYLDKEEPIAEWKKAVIEIDRVLNKLNSMQIDKINVKAAHGVDLTIGIGKNRKWLGGRGCNIPSFEVFITPDCRDANGSVEFDQPLYRYGNLITGIKLEFKEGKVVSFSARSGENILREMISVAGADKIGEFSLTDKRLSRINKFMAETLYDENFGGEHGNTHIALGSSYHDSYIGEKNKMDMKKDDWEKIGFNDSVVHTDIVSTRNRVVTAILENGEKKVIYENGEFKV